MIRIEHDPALSAVVLSARPMLYGEGPDAPLDRPGHVRAGSGICWRGDRLAVIQDDAAFLALIDPATAVASALPLPVDPPGVRLWGDDRGNKRLKPDLEACAMLADGTLLALGSGSTAMRERLLLVSPEGEARWQRAPALYHALREAIGFSGSELNVEGAVVRDGALWLFNRGNGAPRAGLSPANAICHLALEAVLRGEAPRIAGIQPCALGELDDAPFGFTDAALRGDTILFSAAAEASPDSYRDGPVAGSAIGWLADGCGALTPLRDREGRLFAGKVEGIVAAREPGRLWGVVDADDPARPAGLIRIELSGAWPG